MGFRQTRLINASPKRSSLDDESPGESKPAPKSIAPTSQAAPAQTKSSIPFLPYSPLMQNPIAPLKRLLEHFVTHEKGWIAVSSRCEEYIYVELYPLNEGWTVFARYSANGREERVDQLFPYELSQYAERVALALLYDVPISSTIQRDNVLKADSLRSVQRIMGTNHFLLGLGTQLRGGMINTVQNNGEVDQQLRLFSPMTISSGYLGKFENWALEASGQLGIGTNRTGVNQNSKGGHVDFGGDFGISLHFLRYFNPRGLSSFYMGAGSTFELLWFSAIKPEGNRANDPRDTIYGGGLDVDLLCGYEFMRASSVQFFLQSGLQLPAYYISNESEVGKVDTWFPGLTVKLGVMF